MTPTPVRKTLATAVVGAALAATAAARADDNKPIPAPNYDAAGAVTPSAIKKDVDLLRDDIKKLGEDLKSLQTFRKDIADEIYGKRDGATGTTPGLTTRLDSLETTLKKINEQLAKLSDPKSTTALRPADPAPAAAATANVSRVRIVNDYPTEMSMIVNRKSYRVGAGETRTVDVPPGSYTYELLHAGSQPTTSTIKDNETVTLRIR